MRLLMLFLLAFQQPAGDTLYLSLEKAVSIALQNNLSLRAKEQEIWMAKADILKARSAFYPSITGQATYTRLGEVQKTKMLSGFRLVPTGNPQMPYMIVPEFSDFQTTYYNNYGLSLSISQPIFTWGILRKSYKLSFENLKAKELELKSEKLKIEEQVKESYFQLLLARNSLDLLHQVKKELEDNYKSTKQRFEAGYASDFELLRAEVQLKNVEPQILEAEGQIKIAEDAFKNLLGIPDSVPIVLTDTLRFTALTVSQDSLIKEAMHYHSDITLFKKNLDILKKSIDIQKRKNLPTVFYNWAYKYQKPFGTQNEWHGMWTFTLGLQWNIFDGGANKASVSKLRYQLKSLNFTLQSMEEGIALAIRSYYTNAKTLEKTLKAQKANLELAKRAYELAETQYKEGYVTSLDVINAQVQYAQARLNYLKTLANYQIALTRLYYAVRGGLSKTQ